MIPKLLRTLKWPLLLQLVRCFISSSSPQSLTLIAGMVQLEKWAKLIFDRIVDGVDRIPYGMRWICQQLVRFLFFVYTEKLSFSCACFFCRSLGSLASGALSGLFDS